MTQQGFRFTEAEPLLQFIERYRSKIVGHTLKACYIDDCGYTSMSSSGSVFFILDDICFGVEYLFPSDITIFPIDTKDFEFTGEMHDDPHYKFLQFHSHISNRRDEGVIWCTDMPAMGQKVIDIEVERFNHAFQSDINDYRPNGGDYFSYIKLTLTDDSFLFINAQSAVMDGYVDLWLANLPTFNTLQQIVLNSNIDMLHLMERRVKEAVNSCRESPDEMAEFAMSYIQKCLDEHESPIEKGYGGNYSFYLCDILRIIKGKEINYQYKDSSGHSLIDFALRAAETVHPHVLPALLTSSYLDYQFQRMKASLMLEFKYIKSYEEEMNKLYESLPDYIRSTEFGKKVIMKNCKNYSRILICSDNHNLPFFDLFHCIRQECNHT